MNRLWAYLEPGPDEEPRKLVYSEQEILATYWDYWVSQMLRVHKLPMVTEANCIEDWVVLNWAWPLDSVA